MQFDPTEQVNITKDTLREAFEAAQGQIKVMVNSLNETKDLIDEFLQYIEDNKDVESVTETPDIVTRLYGHIKKSFNRATLLAFIDAINKLVVTMREDEDSQDVQGIKNYLNKSIKYFDDFAIIKDKYYFDKIEGLVNPKFSFPRKKALAPMSFYKGYIHNAIPVADPEKYKENPAIAMRLINYILRNALQEKWSQRV